jgi:RecJ-like exonuclease
MAEDPNDVGGDTLLEREVCPACEGRKRGNGHLIVETAPCPICKGLGFVAKTHAESYQDRLTEPGADPRCPACGDTGWARDGSGFCKQCEIKR